MKNRLLERFAKTGVSKALAVLAAISLVMAFLLEALGRHSALDALDFMLGHPLSFLLNSLIVLFTLSICLIGKRRLSLLFVMLIAWLTLGITNCVLLGFRSSPLSAIDFTVAKSALGMMGLYLPLWQILLLAAAALIAIGLLVLLHVKCPRCRVKYSHSLTCIAVLGIGAFAASSFAASISASDGYDSAELRSAYEDYGFAYCFTQSLVAQGVRRPNGFTSEAVDRLIEELEAAEKLVSSEASDEPTSAPNVIFVQLESFIDVSRIENIVFDSDPTPNFNRLKAHGLSGRLTVASIGGGTANTEFEVLTGMNLDHFGFGEYPYTTILKNRACESIAANLAASGYGAHALHNHTATFYDRHIAYASLGFDSFTPVEMMSGVTYNPLGFERDEVLTSEIESALDLTDSADFVFAVSVQGHGKYPEEPVDGDDTSEAYPDHIDGDFVVSGTTDQSLASQYSYYAGQLYETDRFIGELISMLESRGEPSVVVFYGDHLPAIDLAESDIDGGLYTTEYAVWTNTELFDSAKDRDLEAYMLSAYILSFLDIDGGAINSLHTEELESGIRRDDELRLLEYAQLYDNTREPPYKPANMRFGTRNTAVTGIRPVGNTIIITGEGFTPNCGVRLGGFVRECEFISEEILAVANAYFFRDSLSVVWSASDGTVLVER